MGWLWISMGVLLSITIFLYLRHAFYDFKERKQKKERSNDQFDFSTVEKRICPVCHTKLKANEYLYASIYPGEPEDKIFIKGCTHCYRTPKPGDKKL